MFETAIGRLRSPVDRFFEYAEERELVREAKERGVPRGQWTSDPILQKFRFCNVHREDDKVTAWFREHIRGPLSGRQEVLLATVMFRWFNRPETAQRIIDLAAVEHQDDMEWEDYEAFAELDSDLIRQALTGVSPIVTGAYIIKTPNGMTKLEGLIWCLKQFNQGDWRQHRSATLEGTWSWLQQFPFLGGFMAYEIVTDLRHTALLRGASDIMSWANAGPGAVRGLNRIHGRELSSSLRPERSNEEMRELLRVAQGRGLCMWEMREVEHTLCEFDKYERARLGQGEPKQLYR